MASKKTPAKEDDFDRLVAAGYRWSEPFDDAAPEQAQESATPERSSLGRRILVDPALSVLRGTMALPKAAVGLASMATGGRAGKFAEELGFRPDEAGQVIEGLLTPEQQAANAEVRQAQGFAETIGAAIANPSTILHTGIESVPGVVGGAAVGSKLLQSSPALLKMGRAGRAIAAGAGEGVLMAGGQAEEIRRQTADGLLTPMQSLLAGATGLGGGAISALSGGMAARYGDIDQLLMRPVPQAVASGKGGAPLGLMARMTGGAITEGSEELAQSVLEQTLQNKALGRPIDQGVGNAAAMGLLTGGLMGGVAGAIRGGDPIREMKLPEAGPLSKSVNAGLEREAAQEDTLAADRLLERADAILARAKRASLSATSPIAVDAATRAVSAAESAKAALSSGDNEAAASAGGLLDDATGYLRLIREVGGRADSGTSAPAPEGSIAFEPQAVIDTSGLSLAPSDYVAPRPVARTPSEELQRAVWAAKDITLAPSDYVAPQPVARTPSEELQRAVWAAKDIKLSPRIADIEAANPLVRMSASPRKKADGAPTIIDPVAAYVREREAEGTPAGKAFAHEFRVGRITREQVQELMARRPPTADEQIAAAAASAKPEVDTTQRRLEAAARQGAQQQTYGSGIILADNGKPFSSKMVAERRARIMGGGAVVQPAQDGGFVVAQPQPDSVGAAQPATSPAKGAPTALADPAAVDGAPEAASKPGGVGVAEINGAATVQPAVSAPAAPEPSVATAFTHAGLKIAPGGVEFGDGVKERWIIQSPENAEREARGERQLGGNVIVETRQQAIEAAERESKRHSAKKDELAELNASREARLAADEANRAANRKKSLPERRADAILDKPSKLPESAGLGLGSRREAMDRAIEQGRHIAEVMVSDTAAKKRDQEAVDAVHQEGYILDVSNENIPVIKNGLEAQSRLKEGKYQKPEYRVYQGSDGRGPFFNISKTEYDYAQKALAAKTAEAPMPVAPKDEFTSKPQPPAAPVATETPKQIELSKRIAVVEKLIACLKL